METRGRGEMRIRTDHSKNRSVDSASSTSSPSCMRNCATVISLIGVAFTAGNHIYALKIDSGCRGICKDESTTPPPVCGSDGVTYGSDCLLRAKQCRDASVSKAHDGKCTPQPADDNSTSVVTWETVPALQVGPCARVCTQVHLEMCGSDEVTYRNPCHFGVAQCEDNYLTLAQVGGCFLTLPPRPSFCDEDIVCSPTQHEYAPTCGSDGVTYKSDCEFKIAYCSKQASLSVLHEGPCSQ